MGMEQAALDLFRFQFKFRFHRLLHMQIDETDFNRLGAIYGVSPALVEEETAKVDTHNRDCAKQLAARVDLTKLQTANPVKVLFLGDSITSDRTSYCGILRELLRDRETVQVFDTSVPGNKAIDLFSYAYPETFDCHADIAHVMVGTNDILCTEERPYLNRVHEVDFAEKLAYVVRALTEDGTKVILSTIPRFALSKAEVSLQGFRKQYREEDRLRYNGILWTVADRYGAVVNDMEPVYARYTPEELTWSDGYHMSQQGQLLLAEQVLQRIVDLL